MGLRPSKMSGFGSLPRQKHNHHWGGRGDLPSYPLALWGLPECFPAGHLGKRRKLTLTFPRMILMARRKIASDGTPLTQRESWVGFGKKLRCLLEWVDRDGKVWNPADIACGVVAASKANRGPTRAARGIVKAEEVNVNFEERAEARRKFDHALENLSEVDCGRILERLGRKNPREGMGVSGRDMRDIEQAISGVFEQMQRESMRRAVPKTPAEIFIEALRDARAANLSI